MILKGVKKKDLQNINNKNSNLNTIKKELKNAITLFNRFPKQTKQHKKKTVHLQAKK